ncbi:MAG TPA: hypothetical protein VFA97_03240 [Gaiellaceae bacterium]|nr:hypothetical protein [Gaiellaceae bacterium]
MLLAAACLAAVAATVSHSARSATKDTPSCTFANGIKHVVYLQFDNTHYRRDVPNVASDLEQMPHLLNFLQSNGTLFTNDHTILISHTAGGILSSLTGLYPDRNGITVSNSYGYFGSNGQTGFSSAFKYWTDQVDSVFDPKPNMITDGGLNTPAPWVPFTRDGCDVGGVGTANIELENTSTNATGDMTRVFGQGSPEWTEASTNSALAQADFVGIAIHCAQTSSSKCANDANAKPDLLPDEPGGYTGYQALYGAKYVDPAIANGAPCVENTAGEKIADPAGNCGFPGFDGMLAKNTLGYIEQMQESGVPVTYGYISDAHDVHTADPVKDTYTSAANGPGEAGHEAQLKAYDDAFAAFFSNLAAHGIDKSNTLFVITVDEGDHFAGGVGIPQNDGTLAYSHTNCYPTTSCPSNQIGEVNANFAKLLPSGEPSFTVHSDDAPTVYVAGNPSRFDPSVRKLERDAAALQEYDPYQGTNVPLMVSMADPVEEQALHMVNADPARTPTFTYFANDDFFLSTSDPTCGGNPCVAPGFAWNHGDIQQEIGNTWVGFVGPGVAANGVDSTTWTDHTNLRPTILTLLGLKDDYVEDGRVLTEALTPAATPTALQDPNAEKLATLYEQLNAPFGRFGTNTLAASTKAMAGSDFAYHAVSTAIGGLTGERNRIASAIKLTLNRAAFDNTAINPAQARVMLLSGNAILALSGLLPH